MSALEMPDEARYASCHMHKGEAFPHICCASGCPAKPYTGGLAGALGLSAGIPSEESP